MLLNAPNFEKEKEWMFDDPKAVIDVDEVICLQPNNNPMRIYISGTITGDILAGRDWKAKFLKYEEFLQLLFPNATFFNSAREVAGADMFPDHKVPNLEDWQYRTVMTRDLKELVDCDVIALMPDWYKSTGARTEREVAKCLKMNIIEMPAVKL